jgi:hypothetical protein
MGTRTQALSLIFLLAVQATNGWILDGWNPRGNLMRPDFADSVMVLRPRPKLGLIACVRLARNCNEAANAVCPPSPFSLSVIMTNFI